MPRSTIICCICLILPFLLLGQEATLGYEYQDGQARIYLQSHVDCPVFVRVLPGDNLDGEWTYRTNQKLAARSRLEDLLILSVTSHADTVNVLGRALGQFDFNLNLGDPDARPDRKHRYLLPFARGRAYRLIQGFNGSFSHQTTDARYALDFDLPVGDTICAARGGVVVKVREHFTEGGPAEEYRGKDNHVLIYHADGTLGAYAHLAPKGALVEPGDRVSAGQPIGISGFTGYATVPHLHFVVRRTTRAGQMTIPVRFRGLRSLKEGRVYRRKF